MMDLGELGGQETSNDRERGPLSQSLCIRMTVVASVSMAFSAQNTRKSIRMMIEVDAAGFASFSVHSSRTMLIVLWLSGCVIL